MKKIYIITLISILSLSVSSQTRYLKAVLSAAEEVPTNASTATGVVIVRYNIATKYLELLGDYQNLTTNITATHIHSPAPVGTNAPVLVTLSHTGGTTGKISGTATFTAAQEADLLGGNMYVNVHSTTYGGGEIRGQLTTTTLDQTDFLTGRIQAAQEVPPNSSTGSGSVTALLDKGTGFVYLTGTFSGLTASATASHIHRGSANTNGAVFINISFTPATSGTLHVASAIAAADQTLMTEGGTYVNIHNANFPGGEIRGQLIMHTQLTFFKANLQSSQQVPTNPSTATGTVIMKYNSTTRVLDLVGDYQNLTTTISATHIHSPAPAGANAAVLVPLSHTGGTSGAITGTATLTQPQETDLFNGLMYVNVHSSMYGGGEIRGQLSATTAGSETYYLTGSLTGGQQVPSNGSTGSGNVTALLDNVTNQVWLTGNFTGLAANANAAHIHGGSGTVSGPVVVPLTATASTAGTVTGSATVRNTFADSIILGYTYVNIHNASFPGGEIRAQLGNQVLPVQLNWFNGYRQNNKVALVWETMQELNFGQYEIEQQDLATKTWIRKAVIPGRDATSITRYTHLDDPILSGSNYVLYRLKLVDKDGRPGYSPVIKINFKDSKAEIILASNPVQHDRLNFIITGLNANKQATVSVIDQSGRIVSKGTASTFSNNSINISSLPSGIYRLLIRVDEEIFEQSFVK